MKIIIKNNYADMSTEAFRLFAEAFRDSESLGFATGNTPKALYRMISSECKAGRLSFRGKCTFNLDEYYPISSQNSESYWSYMNENLFNNIDIDRRKINFPRSMPNADETVNRYIEKYSRFGPVDLQILGIGRNGHIGFNEPGTTKYSTIRIVDLSPDTIKRNNAPVHKAITMGIREILESRKIILLASGSDKSWAVSDAVTGRITKSLPASFLQEHADTTLILDREAASRLHYGGNIEIQQQYPNDHA